MWLKDEWFEGVVHAAWYLNLKGDPMGKVLWKVSNCQTRFQLWDKHTFGNIRIALAQKKKQLVQAKGESMAGKGIPQCRCSQKRSTMLQNRVVEA